MTFNSLRKLLVLELERYWSFPVAEIVFGISMFALWNRQQFAEYSQLWYAYVYVPTFLILIVGLTTTRSFAGSISSREMNTLLSYPIRRSTIFMAKLITNLLVPVMLFSAAVLFAVPFLGLNIFEPAILCSVALSMSLIIKSEMMSVFAFVLVFFGLEFSLGFLQPPYQYLNFSIGSGVIFNYLTSLFHSGLGKIALQDFTIAFGFPILTSSILTIGSFVYFRWKMQLD
jgi:ABC-type transport system involved in multi-copper enzyme maturation permease subunit